MLRTVKARAPDPDEIRSILRRSAKPRGPKEQYGAGILDAAAAVKLAKEGGRQLTKRWWLVGLLGVVSLGVAFGRWKTLGVDASLPEVLVPLAVGLCLPDVFQWLVGFGSLLNMIGHSMVITILWLNLRSRDTASAAWRRRTRRPTCSRGRRAYRSVRSSPSAPLPTTALPPTVPLRRFTTIGDPIPYTTVFTGTYRAVDQTTVSDLTGIRRAAAIAKAAFDRYRAIGFGAGPVDLGAALPWLALGALGPHMQYPNTQELAKYDALGNPSVAGPGAVLRLQALRRFKAKR